MGEKEKPPAKPEDTYCQGRTVGHRRHQEKLGTSSNLMPSVSHRSASTHLD